MQNAMQYASIATHRNSKCDEQGEVSVVRNVLKENGRLLALRLLVSQQLAASGVFFVTCITFVFLLWRSIQCFSTGEHV